MGLDGCVACNCLKEGKTTPPPVPLELIYWEDWYWGISIPYEGNEALYVKFDRWLENCCEHHNMIYCSKGVSNWSGLRLFTQMLYQIGADSFPVLLACLPKANGGEVTPESAARALEELRYFEMHISETKNLFLVDSEKGVALHQYIEAYNGQFSWGGSGQRLASGINAEGFFIYSECSNRMLFCSQKFEQKILSEMPESKPVKDIGEENQSWKQLRAEFTDIASGSSFVGAPISDYNGEYPRYMHIEWRMNKAEDFDYALRSLEALFKASIETGNPVAWH